MSTPLMNVRDGKVMLPAGWRKLRAGEVMKDGDLYVSGELMGTLIWKPVCDIGWQCGHGRTYIRRVPAKGKARK